MSINGTENRDKKIEGQNVGIPIILPFGGLILPIFLGTVTNGHPTTPMAREQPWLKVEDYGSSLLIHYSNVLQQFSGK